jgi:hypothetical protein
VPFDAGHIRDLRTAGRTRVAMNGADIGIEVVEDGEPAGALDLDTIELGPSFVVPGFEAKKRLLKRFGHRWLDPNEGNGDGSADAEPSSPVGVPQFSKSGLPIAVLLPWRQTWTLTGFSRGNLLSSLALAPGEEVRISVASWEKRAKALDQSAETEVEQSFDFTSTTRDTEDVLKEVVQSNDFHAQANASLDASYSPGTASITVHADGGVTNDASLATTARTSTQRVREITTRAATKVRSKRVTRITETFEQTAANEVVRTIRNPNVCNTLTLNFHEVLSHYDVDVRFNAPAVRLVVLIPNPEPTRTFTELAARVHEDALRTGLLDAALGDGFEACRLLAAYKYAEEEIRRLSNLAKQELDQDRQRTEPKAGEDKKPPNPHLATLQGILADLKSRYGPIASADVLPGLRTIADWKVPPPPDEVVAANRWLWRRLVSFKFGDGLLTALGELLSKGAPGPDDARRVVASTPALGSFPSLDGLGGLSEKEKEDAGLYGKSAANRSDKKHDGGALEGPWWWWYPRLKDSGFYNVADGGIPGLLTALRTKLSDWETKEAEGAGLEQAQAAVDRAQNEQERTTIADRLEMKFGAETVGAAFERREALLAHLNQHCDYYRFVLFQSMPPSEQLQRITELAPQLKVGTFEPHVVASDGPNLAVPLTPLATTTIAKVVSNLSCSMEEATHEALVAADQIATDQVIMTTPGVSVESWLGDCGGCEEHLEKERSTQLRLSVAQARQSELHADRLAARLAAKPPDLTDPSPPVAPAIAVHVDGDG